MMMKVGVLGDENLGGVLAQELHGAGFDVSLFREWLDIASSPDGHPSLACSAFQVPDRCDIVLSLLSLPHIDTFCERALAPGGVCVVFRSIPPDCTLALESCNIPILAASLLGRPDL